ncbi:MAG: hypothetical protein LWX51_08375 [Deltaproteobacteria bacterium]|jgi:hypothetical protein|nr:hypothetical protein [Deltaproteobacteria bacterium]
MSEKDINIAGRKIGPGHSPFIIAEMSGNHNTFVKVGFSESVISTVGINLMHLDSMGRRK